MTPEQRDLLVKLQNSSLVIYNEHKQKVAELEFKEIARLLIEPLKQQRMNFNNCSIGYQYCNNSYTCYDVNIINQNVNNLIGHVNNLQTSLSSMQTNMCSLLDAIINNFEG